MPWTLGLDGLVEAVKDNFMVLKAHKSGVLKSV